MERNPDWNVFLNMAPATAGRQVTNALRGVSGSETTICGRRSRLSARATPIYPFPYPRPTSSRE